MRPAKEDDLVNLPSFIMTSPMEWDPKVLDSEINLDLDDWYDPDDINMSGYFDYLFNKKEVYRWHEVQNI